MSQPLDDREREELVAFLDGELTGEEARVIERRLSLDPTAREEAEALRRTWDLLDFLPRPEPSSSFTEKTLTRLSAVRMEAFRPRPLWRDWRSMGLGVAWLALVGLATVAGFKGYSHLAAGTQGTVRDGGGSEKAHSERLPGKLKEKLDNLEDKEREDQLVEVTKEQEALRKVWTETHVNFETWKPRPTRLVDFPLSVQKFVREELEPRLNPGELHEMKQAEEKAKWPDYAQAILRLARQHPRYPGLPAGDIKDEKSLRRILPATTAKAFLSGPVRSQLDNVTGQWPEFALKAVELSRYPNIKTQLPPLGASKLEEFPDDMKAVIKKELIPVLVREDKAKNNGKLMDSLNRLEGHWPEYPKRVLELAKRHGVVIPGMSIPGPSEFWKAVESGVQ